MQTSDEIIVSWLENNNVLKTPLSKTKINKFKVLWRKKFATNVRKTKGVWRYNGYDWHAFSFEIERAEVGFKALRKVLSKNDASWYLWGDGNSEFGFIIKGITPCNLSNLYDDYILTSLDFKWTAAFTHESQCGPYYSEIG